MLNSMRSEESLKVFALAAVNFTAEAGKRVAGAWDNAIANSTPTLHFLLVVVQVLVACVTVWYIVRKTLAIKSPLKKKRRRR